MVKARLPSLRGIRRRSRRGIRNFFLRFTPAHIEAFWRPLWRWLLGLMACPKAGFSLELDSTVFCREGSQEGAAKGYNPRRKWRKSHHPLMAVLAEAPFILHGWLRSGNTSFEVLTLSSHASIRHHRNAFTRYQALLVVELV